MGWFFLSTIVGYAGNIAWSFLGKAEKWGLFVLAILVAGLWALFFTPTGIVQSFAAAVDNYTFVRALLGFVLGASAAKTINQPQLSTAWLSLAASILILALVTPYVDGWLSRLTGFKTSVIEIQLANLSSTSKALQPVQRDQFIRDVALKSLTEYDKSIQSDIEFIDRFELADIYRMKKDKQNVAELEKQENRLIQQRTQLEVLKNFFANMVSPAARCFKMALDHGLSLESVRYHLRSLADELTQLVILERDEKEHPGAEPDRLKRIEQRHREVLEKVIATTKGIVGFVEIGDRKDCQPQDVVASSALVSTEYNLVPHLDVARAFLLLFVNHDRLGREVLRDASSKEYKDFNTPRVLAQLMYYEGDGITQYYDLLAGLRLLARQRLETINRVIDACGSSCSEELKSSAKSLRIRAEKAELVAVNKIAYGVASDAAEKHPEAEAMLPIADDCIATLKKAAPLNKADTDSQDESLLGYMDTIAFVTIVSEWEKAKTADLDKAKVKEAITLLQKVAAREEALLSDARKKSKAGSVDYSTLKTVQAHLSSARGLLD
jgi:hypothetical protein